MSISPRAGFANARSIWRDHILLAMYPDHSGSSLGHKDWVGLIRGTVLRAEETVECALKQYKMLQDSVPSPHSKEHKIPRYRESRRLT